MEILYGERWVLMCKKRVCPNCDGTGREGSVPAAFSSKHIKTVCWMCAGTKVVDAFDYERLLTLITPKDAVQVELTL